LRRASSHCSRQIDDHATMVDVGGIWCKSV
jgi:hypothetical protein